MVGALLSRDSASPPGSTANIDDSEAVGFHFIVRRVPSLASQYICIGTRTSRSILARARQFQNANNITVI